MHSIPLVSTIGFLVLWIGLSIFVFAKRQSSDGAAGRGFFASLAVFVVAGMMVSAIFPSHTIQASSASNNAARQPDSTLEFDSVTISTFYAASAAMIYCDRLTDAQAKAVGDTVRYMAKMGGIPDSEVKASLLLGGTVAKEDIEESGGCGGAHFQDYKRNYFEYIGDPAIAHLQVLGDSGTNEPQLSQFDRVLAHLDNSSSAVCRNFAKTLRNTNPGAEESILRTAKKYGCL